MVFDALGTPSLGWALLQEIRKVTDRKIRYVIASHYHADHIYGLQAFKDHTDAVIVAQERAGEYKDNEETADEKASQRLDQRRGVLFPWVDKNTRVVAPDITFRDRMTIALGDKRLTLLYAGPAHSSSDMMMLVEPDGVLFAGDIVQNGRIPHMNSDDVSTTQWLAALAEVEKLDPKFIIPGHGKASAQAKEAIAFTRDYIRTCAARWRRRCRIGPISTWPMRRPTGRNTATCRPSPPTTAATPTGSIWNWSNRSSKLISSNRYG